MALKKAIAMLCLILTGCGGGNSVPAVTTMPNPAVPLQTAMANIVNTGFSKRFNVSGLINTSAPGNPASLSPVSGSGNMTFGPPVGATFNGASALATTGVIGSVTGTGPIQSIASTFTYFYNPSNYTVVGISAGGVTAAMAPYTYQATVQAGDAACVPGGTTGANSPTTITMVCTVASYTTTSLLVALETIQKLGSGTATNAPTDRDTETAYLITASGSISIVSMTTQLFNSVQSAAGSYGYGSLTFTFQ